VAGWIKQVLTFGAYGTHEGELYGIADDFGASDFGRNQFGICCGVEVEDIGGFEYRAGVGERKPLAFVGENERSGKLGGY